VADPTAADGSAAIFIIAPAAGTLANYTAPRSVKVSFVAARFDSAGLRDGSGLLSNVTHATAIAVDGAVVARALRHAQHHLARRPHSIQLFEATVTAAHACRQNQKCRFHVFAKKSNHSIGWAVTLTLSTPQVNC
jgi:hypothetical protein